MGSKYSPGGAGAFVFASGVSPLALAFDAAGNLFEGDSSGNIYKFTPDGTRTTFASGVGVPAGLAFQGLTLPVPEPSTWALAGMGAAALVGFLARRATSAKASSEARDSTATAP